MTAKLCRSCGKPVIEGAKFCTECGATLEVSSTEQDLKKGQSEKSDAPRDYCVICGVKLTSLSWRLEDGSFLCNACNEESKKAALAQQQATKSTASPKNCEDCGAKLTMLNTHLKYRNKCGPCGQKEMLLAQQQAKIERAKARLCSYCGAKIGWVEKHWTYKDGSPLCNACHEDPNRLVEGRLCLDCGGQLESAVKSWRLEDGSGFICKACHEERKKKEEPRFCSDCGTQIDTDEKHWKLKDGSGFICNACNEERKKTALAQQQPKKQREEVAFVTYLGGFAGVTGTHGVKMHFEATQVTVQDSPLLGKGQVLWVMPYNKIKDIRIDTAENLTAARLLLTGILAFGLKKKESYLVVSFEDKHGLVQNPVFEGLFINGAMKSIYKRIESAPLPPVDQQPQQPPAAPIDVAEQIEKLGKLRDKGLLTEQEFDSKKQELLARM